ncbi:MAG: pyridoxal 5'-phosphate synthase glutaminase subunit PdxT [Dehalococcoidia bacterium]
MPNIGILALQGDFAEHADMLESVGARAYQVRKAEQLNDIDGLIIPGGESTTICRLMAAFDLLKPLRAFAATTPVWGTCAGMIVLARRASDLNLPSIGVLDIGVRRNAFGRQLDSFETDISVPLIGSEPLHAVFIRAPVVEEVGPDVDVLSRLDDGRVVAVQEGHLLATAFHPELTADDRLHRHFLSMTARPPEVGAK